MEQIWKDIEGYEGLYQISNDAQVKSLPKTWRTGRGAGRPHTTAELILKPFVSRHGYLRVALSKESKYRKIFIHRLVAAAFCPGKFDAAVVNHKDGNKLNCLPSNLEWVTACQNAQHAFDTGLRVCSEKTKQAVSSRHRGAGNCNAKKVLDTVTGQTYDTIADAAAAHNIKPHNLYVYLRGVNSNNTTLRYA